MIGIGLIALAFTILLVFAHFERKHRRRDMGLPPLPAAENWTWPTRHQTKGDTK